MTRPKTANDQQIAIKVPKALLARASALVGHMAAPGITVTRTDVLRVALLRGLDSIEAEVAAKKPKGHDR